MAVEIKRKPAGNLNLASYLVAGALLIAASVAMVTPALAATYEGYGRTGWDYRNKSYCCEDAIAIAQENAARSCEAAGGLPNMRRSSARGRCDWDTNRGGGGTVYRCNAKASVSCR